MSASRALPLLYALAVACVAASAARAAPCFDVSKGQPKSLIGVLRHIIFPGPPNYTDVQQGDTPEPTYVLQLEHSICIKGDPFADPVDAFDAVQLVGNAALWPVMRGDVGKTVGVALTQSMAAENGHHHEPLVAWVTSIVTLPPR